MKKNNPSSLIRLAKMMKPYMKYLYFVFFCVLVSNLGVLVKPYLVKIIIDDFSDQRFSTEWYLFDYGIGNQLFSGSAYQRWIHYGAASHTGSVWASDSA